MRSSGWCKLGVRDVDIALFFDVSLTTVKNWQREYPEFFMAMLRGKQKAYVNVAAALYQNAIEGDTTAQIFWLKNRRPDLWRDLTRAPEDEVASKARVYVGVEILEALGARVCAVGKRIRTDRGAAEATDQTCR